MDVDVEQVQQTRVPLRVDVARQRALRLLHVSGYVGPAPVSVEAYTEMIYYHHSRFPEVALDDVRALLGMGIHAALGMAIYTGRLSLESLAALA